MAPEHLKTQTDTRTKQTSSFLYSNPFLFSTETMDAAFSPDNTFSRGRRVDVVAGYYKGTDGWVVKVLPAHVRVSLRYPSRYRKKDGILMRKTSVVLRQDRSTDRLFPTWTGGRYHRSYANWELQDLILA
jgi:hypothetical protein